MTDGIVIDMSTNEKMPLMRFAFELWVNSYYPLPVYATL